MALSPDEQELARKANVPDAWADDFIRRNPGDWGRLDSAYESERPQESSQQSRSPWESSGGGQSGGGGGQRNDAMSSLLQEMWTSQKARDAENAAREAERRAKSDALYNTLQSRAQQGLNVDPNDPIIKAQVDQFRAEQDRAYRNLISDAAESGGGLGDTRKRMATERIGQAVGGLQAQLMARELSSRRSEIADALSSMGGMLDSNQQAGLQRELAGLDNAIKQYQLGMGDRDLDLRRDLGFGDLDLRRQLGNRGLDIDEMRTLMQDRQFYGDLGLRGRTQDDYYDLVRRGRLGN